MLKINHLLIFVSILIALSSSLALFFVVSDEKTCFTVEQPKDTPIVFAYEVLLFKKIKLNIFFAYYIF